MATFTDVSSRFDLEAIIDENVLRHVLQIFYEGEDNLYDSIRPYFKNYDAISRDYELDFQVTQASNPCMKLLEFEEESSHFYLLVNPFFIETIDFKIGLEILSNFEDAYVVLRINRNINFNTLLNTIKESDDDQLFDAFEDSFRIQGVIFGLALSQGSNTLIEFQDATRSTTEQVFNSLRAVPELEDMFSKIPEAVESLLPIIFNDETLYRGFLAILHKETTISNKIKEAFAEINIASPLAFNRIAFRPFTGAVTKLGVYANFNTISLPPRGSVDSATRFALASTSGLGINLTENLVQHLFMATIRFEMAKLLNEDEITESVFDDVVYSFPFTIPTAIFDSLDAEAADGKFEVNDIKTQFKSHKFPDQNEKIDAFKISFVLSNDNDTFFEDVLDAIIPNPRIHFFIGFEASGSRLKLLIDHDINIPFNLLTAIVMPTFVHLLSPVELLIKLFGFTVLSNLAMDLFVEPLLDKAIKDPSLDIGFPILKKRWDPFYVTHHKLQLNVGSTFINENTPQLKFIVAPSLTKSFKPYEGVYLKNVEFSENDVLTEVTYAFDTLDTVIRDVLPGTDRQLAFYDYDTSLTEVVIPINTQNFNRLQSQKLANKIAIHIPYTPKYVELVDGAISEILILSHLREQKIKDLLVAKYLKKEQEKFIKLFYNLIQIIVPDFDVATITTDQLKAINKELIKLIKDTLSYNEYKNEKWELELPGYLSATKAEMLQLTPKQIYLLGMRTLSSKDSALRPLHYSHEYMEYIDLPNYQSIIKDGQHIIKNKPNDYRNDNLLSLPKFRLPRIEITLDEDDD